LRARPAEAGMTDTPKAAGVPTCAGDSRAPGRRARITLFAYLLHLTLPVLLAADVLLAGHFDHGEVVVLAGSVLWLAAGSIPLLCSRRGRFLELIENPLVAFYAVCFVLPPAEMVLRLLVPAGLKPMLYRPGTRVRTLENPLVTPGVSGVSTYSVNNVGVRGPDLPLHAKVYRVVAVGGSATECMDLDDRDEWPRLLMERLNHELGDQHVWVGNSGVSGHTTVHHLWMMRALPLVASSDMVILMAGINDLLAALSTNGQSTQSILEADARRFCTESLAYSRKQRSYFKRLELHELVRHVRLTLYVRVFQRIEIGTDLILAGRKRRSAARRAALPPLHVGLEEYSQRVRTIADECRKNRQRCVFLTQPTMWRDDLPEAQRRLLWLGWVGNRDNPWGYASVEDLTRSMDAYNGRLLEVCSSAGLECYDLASAIPKDTSAFFDDCHFNVSGSRAVARFIADQLLRRTDLLVPSGRALPVARAP
jgi:hypothetical protein